MTLIPPPWNVWRRALTDLLFPPSEHELRVRALTPEKLAHLLTVSHARSIEALFPYKHPDIRALLWQLKYKNDSRAAELLGGELRHALLDSLQSPHIVIPIPLSRERARARGYNQLSAVLRHAVRDLPHLTLDENALVRVLNTTPQTTLTRYERLKNLHGAFAVLLPHTIVGKDLLLIDDVTTTGATLREAQETLQSAGARRVRCIALAH